MVSQDPYGSPGPSPYGINLNPYRDPESNPSYGINLGPAQPVVVSYGDKGYIPEPRTAQAAEHPCQLYAHSHAPFPSRTQYHHRHPVYLQNRVYGQIRDADPKHMLWVCGLCHDSIHDWLGFLLGETRKPIPEPGRWAQNEAQRAYNWYIQAGGKL